MTRIKFFYYLFILVFIFNLKTKANGFFIENKLPKSFLLSFTSNSDTLIARKNWVTKPYIPVMKSDSISLELRTSNVIFTEKWINDVLFVYENIKYPDLPDKITLPLLKQDEDFYFNWYGLLYWGYGPRWGKIHRGLDIYLVTGDSVVSSFDGIVRYARYNEGGYGNCVIVRHLNGLETLHGHLSKISVKENQFVNAGNLLGLGGSTGRSDGPHLHFETRYKDFSFDPYFLINKETNTLITDTAVINKSDIIYYRYPSEAPLVKHKGKHKKGKYKKGKGKNNKSKTAVKGKKAKVSKGSSKKKVSSTKTKKSGAAKSKVKGKSTIKTKKNKT